jgi:Protein of unknown function (DUF3800)
MTSRLRWRLFIDEVGNGDLSGASSNPNERYLSLTALLTSIDVYHQRFRPEIENLKKEIFGEGGQEIILHRREILRREGPFKLLSDLATANKFNDRLLFLLEDLPYLAITVIIDKREHLQIYGEWAADPYHYCLEALIERFALWLRKHDYRGDIVIEARAKKQDKRVKQVFTQIYEQGTQNIRASIIQEYLTSREIKLMIKTDNCPAMQIVDLIAHPSARGMRFERSGEAHPSDFGTKIFDILQRKKYARHPQTGEIAGWGQKWFPK